MFVRSTVPTPPRAPSGSVTRGFSKTLLIIIIVVVIVVAALISVIAYSTVAVAQKNITPYSAPVSQNPTSPSSMNIVDVNGGINVVSYNQANVLINGTVTARGFGSTNAVTFIENNASGIIDFEAVFPNSGFFSGSYTVDINVYVPVSARFGSAQFTTVNGNIQVSSVIASSVTATTTNGNVQASSITATALTVKSTNGNVNFACSLCGGVSATTTNGNVVGALTIVSPTGTYTLTSTNGNIDATLPASGSYRLTGQTTNGSIATTGLAGATVSTRTNYSVTVGTGLGVVNLTTVNGSISITGK